VISGIAERCAAVIQAWYPVEEGGNAVADILYGNVSPSAKLSVSYPNVEIYDEPLCYNTSLEKDPRVQWPFGYGLSYATFEYSDLQLDAKASTSDEYVNLTFNVKNTGNVAADEIAQVYLSPATQDQNIRPIQLQGFARVSLEPGQTRTVCVKLHIEQFGYYTNDGVRQWNIAPGTFEVKVGASSTDIKLYDKVALTGKHVTKPLRGHYFSEVTIK
jgi:beta-glucosidase